MKNNDLSSFFYLILLTAFTSCASIDIQTTATKKTYTPVDQALYDTIVQLDQHYFNAYNSCDLKTQAALYSESIEFYHDKGGLMTDKQKLIDAIENNICGKVTRTLVPGSIEVYPIKDYGAVQMGYHKFYNNQEPTAPSKASRFIMIWQHNNDTWQITKVISLH